MLAITPHNHFSPLNTVHPTSKSPNILTMDLPSQYKRAAFKEAGASLVIEDVPMITPSTGEVLVKVEACGVCFSDHIAQAHGMGGKLYVDFSPQS